MAKKVVPIKKISPKKTISTQTKKKTPSKTNLKNENIEKVLIENFIALQKVMTHFATKFDNLSIQISKLLELFEISAKTLAEKDIRLSKGKDTKEEGKMAEKLDTLLDQNKIIARGLTLLHEPAAEIPMQTPRPQQIRQPMPPQIAPPMPSQQPSPIKQTMGDGYKKSIQVKDQTSPNPKLVKKNEKVFE